MALATHRSTAALAPHGPTLHHRLLPWALPATRREARPQAKVALAAASSSCLLLAAGHQRARRVARRSVAPELVEASLVLSSTLDAATFARPLQVGTALASAILCHEAGHFLCARTVGLPAVEFSLGFGPQILTSLDESQGSGTVDESVEFRDAEDDAVVLERASGRIDVKVNGELVWTGIPVLNQTDGTLDCGGGTCVVPAETRSEVQSTLDRATEAAAAAAEEEETEFSLRALPIGGYVRFSELKNVKLEDGTMVSKLDSLPTPAQLWVYAGGVLANMVIAWTSLCAGALTAGVPQTRPLPGIRVESVGEDAAIRTGLKVKDVLLRIGDLDLNSPGQSVKKTVEFIRGLPLDMPTSVTVDRAGQQQVVDVLPVMDPSTGLARLGVMINANTERFMVKASNFPEAAGVASDTVQRLLGEQLEALKGLLNSAGAGGGEVVGPVGILKQGADLTESEGLVGLGLFFVTVNLNLALLNALPVPALDGGKAAFAIAGEVLGQRVDEKKKQDVEYAFILLVLVGLFSLTVKDVTKLFKL